jgi:hypothetical protein
MRHAVSGQPGGGRIVHFAVVEHGALLFACDRCEFRRTYGTRRGAVQGVSEHLPHVHRVQAVLGGV